MVKQWKLQLQYQQVTSTLIAPITCFKPFSWFSVLRCHIPRTDRHRLRSVRVRPHLVKSTFAAVYSKPLLCTVIIKETSPTLHTITTFGFCWNHLPVLFWWCPDDLTSNAKELKNYYLHRYLLTYQNEPQKRDEPASCCLMLSMAERTRSSSSVKISICELKIFNCHSYAECSNNATWSLTDDVLASSPAIC